MEDADEGHRHCCIRSPSDCGRRNLQAATEEHSSGGGYIEHSGCNDDREISTDTTTGHHHGSTHDGATHDGATNHCTTNHLATYDCRSGNGVQLHTVERRRHLLRTRRILPRLRSRC
jgi:hypothetical protein